MNLFRLKKAIPTNHRINKRALLLVAFVLACFAPLPRGQAAPDPAAIPGGNTRDGAGSLASRTTGQFNSAFGTNALNKLTTGNNNAAQGNSALFSNVDGNGNTGLGVLALRLNIHGDRNTAVGYKALYSNTSTENVAVGTQALYSNTGGVNNTGLGFQALFSNTGGSLNTATGDSALLLNTAGGGNTATGVLALFRNKFGDSNTASGRLALRDNITGSFNTALGDSAGSGVISANNVICIGANVIGADVSNTTWINNVYAKTTLSGTTLPVIVSNSGQLGTTASSRRFKNEIKAMEQSSETILALKPVTFHYKSDSTGTPQFGLIAEEVAEVNPDLVVRDDKGEIYSVRYDAVNVMLLNEFLKEHRKVQDQEKRIDALTAQLKDQAAQIQKVSAQVEASKPAPQTVVDN